MTIRNSIRYLILSLLLIIGFNSQAQYFQAQKVNENIKASVNKNHGSDMFTATSKGISVFGQVFAGGKSVNMGLAFLFSYDTIQNIYSFYAGTNIQKMNNPDLSYYYFDNVPPGEYTVMVALSMVYPFSDQYAPTYLGNTFYWDKANRFKLNSPGYNYVIDFINIEQKKGPSSISGQVLEGNMKAPGDPVENVPIYLIDNQSKIRAFTQSDMYGEYWFDSLSLGNYYIYSNLINYKIFPSVAITSTCNPLVDSINIYIGNGVVTSMENTTPSQLEAHLYPNPTTDFCFVDMKLQSESQVSIRVFDISGREVLTPLFNKRLPKGKYSEKIDVNSLANGNYFIIVDAKLETPKVLQFIKN